MDVIQGDAYLLNQLGARAPYLGYGGKHLHEARVYIYGEIYACLFVPSIYTKQLMCIYFIFPFPHQAAVIIHEEQ